jgi:hypothetical protein
MNVDIMVIEVQWVCSLLSQILGLDSDKYVVEVMLDFLLTFFKSEPGLSVHINFDQFLVDTKASKVKDRLPFTDYCQYDSQKEENVPLDGTCLRDKTNKA